MITHIVLISPAPDAAAELERVGRDAVALADEIPGIVAVDFGPDTSPEDLANGYTHALVVTFVDAAARDAYLPHPAHRAFAARMGAVISSVAVVDLETPGRAHA